MQGRLFLSGGGNEKQSFEIDRIFLQNIDSILYVPAARRVETYSSCLEWFKNLISLHKPVKITMLSDLKSNPKLDNYDAVYIGGGNTYRLLKKIKECGLDKKLLNYYKNGGTVYGGSAGAIIWGNDIDLSSIGIDSDKNEDNLRDTSGLDILHGADIQCHYRTSQLKSHMQYSSKTGRQIIAIPEESAVLIENGNSRVIGQKPVFVINSKVAKKYNVNSELK